MLTIKNCKRQVYLSCYSQDTISWIPRTSNNKFSKTIKYGIIKVTSCKSQKKEDKNFFKKLEIFSRNENIIKIKKLIY